MTLFSKGIFLQYLRVYCQQKTPDLGKLSFGFLQRGNKTKLRCQRDLKLMNFMMILPCKIKPVILWDLILMRCCGLSVPCYNYQSFWILNLKLGFWDSILILFFVTWKFVCTQMPNILILFFEENWSPNPE